MSACRCTLIVCIAIQSVSRTRERIMSSQPTTPAEAWKQWGPFAPYERLTRISKLIGESDKACMAYETFVISIYRRILRGPIGVTQGIAASPKLMLAQDFRTILAVMTELRDTESADSAALFIDLETFLDNAHDTIMQTLNEEVAAPGPA